MVVALHEILRTAKSRIGLEAVASTGITPKRRFSWPSSLSSAGESDRLPAASTKRLEYNAGSVGVSDQAARVVAQLGQCGDINVFGFEIALNHDCAAIRRCLE
jgi:hypothetical protein